MCTARIITVKAYLVNVHQSTTTTDTLLFPAAIADVLLFVDAFLQTLYDYALLLETPAEMVGDLFEVLEIITA
jgi:hypothetical protein